jgi:hypothetical protein
MSKPVSADIDRQLPIGDTIFLDHVTHFVRDAQSASNALQAVGFAPTPISIQIQPDDAGGSRPTGTGNITVMFTRGYVEVLFRTVNQPVIAEFDAALARYTGLHLVAFAVTDAEQARARLAATGFPVRDLLRMRRPVQTETGSDIALFTIARVEPGVMPEGRIQMLTHHTEHAVWQARWLSHSNTTLGLADVVIAVADIEEAVQRFERFTGRAARQISGGALLCLDRGGVVLLTRDTARDILPGVAVPTLPFIAGYALKVGSLIAANTAVADAGLEWRSFKDGVIAVFPPELGDGAWFFVEHASALPWRKQL